MEIIYDGKLIGGYWRNQTKHGLILPTSNRSIGGSPSHIADYDCCEVVKPTLLSYFLPITYQISWCHIYIWLCMYIYTPPIYILICMYIYTYYTPRDIYIYICTSSIPNILGSNLWWPANLDIFWLEKLGPNGRVAFRRPLAPVRCEPQRPVKWLGTMVIVKNLYLYRNKISISI